MTLSFCPSHNATQRGQDGSAGRRDGPQKSPLKPVQCPLFKSLTRRQRDDVATGFYLERTRGRHILFTLCCSGIGKQESCEGAVRQLGGETQRSTKEMALDWARNPGFLYCVYLHYYVSKKYHAHLFDPRQSVAMVFPSFATQISHATPSSKALTLYYVHCRLEVGQEVKSSARVRRALTEHRVWLLISTTSTFSGWKLRF